MLSFDSSRGACAAACTALVSLSICSGIAAAQPAQTLIVTGAREALAPERLAADVVAIDAEALRHSTADSLADVLRREAGLQLSRNGGPGQTTGVFLRGAANSQSVLLVDGVRIGSATLGFAAYEALGLAQIERVEVLRGPGSSLYGADAVGGVVQVFTRSGSPGTQLEGRAAIGGYGSRELSGGLRGVAGAFDYAASLSSESSDGVSALQPGDAFGNYNPDRDGYRLDAAHLRLGWRPAAGQRLGLMLLRSKSNSQYDASEFEPPSFKQNPSPDFRTRLTTDVAAIDWRGDLAPVLKGSARASRSIDSSESGGNTTRQFRTERQQFGGQIAWQTGVLGQLVAALEHNVEQTRTSNYAAEVERRTDAGIVELTGSAGAWSWQADARRDDSSDYGAVGTGRLGGALTLAAGLRLRALAGSTFRAPSFNDLYFPGYGVATVRPERGRSVEVGLVWRGDVSDASATLYRNRVRDLIGYESDRKRCPPDPAYAFGCASNTSRAVLEGATLAAAHRMGALRLKGQLDFLEARNAATGSRLARRAAHQATVGADWQIGAWTFGTSVLDLGARPDGGKQLAAETTLDLMAQWRFASDWQLQAKLLNAGNRATEPVRDYQGLGRQAWLVLRYEPRL